MSAPAGTGTESGSRATGNSSGLSSYLLYIVLIVLAGGGVFVYRKKNTGKERETIRR